ncbi:MAG: Co2+/Mg2+ efflux protein ApaG [Gemmatimonadota bacterium]|uniref:ApaG domain-containing protein n=1 Tax=marine metagenome TaxID=408172 RepID=A0A381Q569_9ZZZZ|nr:Co2+/Mg2+ efflux protein ApaG [Gemmatimonadota bacterium]|tara:strand:+ start:851 stop:1264 length:414 start_codon:yes stop_codon:yes gene_type:complete
MDYKKTTEGIRVVVRPSFSLPHSEPADGKFVFTYLVQMENQSAEAAQLLFRHWHIHDSEGEDSELEGEGVLGEQPSLAPGKSHVYESFCVLQSPVGFMEGYYTFVRPNGERFRVNVPRFDLRAPWTVGGGPKAEQMN